MVRQQPATDVEAQNEAEVAISETDLVSLSDQVRRTGRRVVVTRDGSADLVILSAADYEQLTESLDVAQALLQGEADFAAGRSYTHEEVMAEVKARIEGARRDRETARRAG